MECHICKIPFKDLEKFYFLKMEIIESLYTYLKSGEPSGIDVTGLPDSIHKKNHYFSNRDGRVFKYDVSAPTEMAVATKVTEHLQRMADTGYYRHNDGNEYELIPINLDGDCGIYKMKSHNIPTNYPDRTERT